MQPTQTQLDELVQRIVTTVHPMRIILFGSAVRGDMSPSSDLDVLVVMPEGTNRRHTAQELHRNFFGLSFPVDILVTTPSLLERHQDNIGLIYRTILHEGRELYAAWSGVSRLYEIVKNSVPASKLAGTLFCSLLGQAQCCKDKARNLFEIVIFMRRRFTGMKGMEWMIRISLFSYFLQK